MSDPFFTVLVVLAPFAVFFVALAFGVFGRRRGCPGCGEPLPVLSSPLGKTRRMWLEGGHLCPRCGCESDRAGRRVPADAPPPALPLAQIALLALLVAGAGIAAAGSLLRSKPPAPPAAAPPQQAPAQARPN